MRSSSLRPTATRTAAHRRGTRLKAALLALPLVAGCVHPAPLVREEGTLRVFGGERVLGHYVSPSAYYHYLQAQIASLAGRNDEAAAELRQAIASDGISPYLRTRLGEELTAIGQLDEARES